MLCVGLLLYYITLLSLFNFYCLLCAVIIRYNIDLVLITECFIKHDNNSKRRRPQPLSLYMITVNNH